MNAGERGKGRGEMSSGRRVMIGIGATIIVGMLLVTAFSMGVYVGQHGWTRQGLSLAGPGQQPAGPPSLVGQVRGLEDGFLNLATQEGPRTVEVDEQTQVRTAQGEVVGVDVLQPGILVAIFGHPGAGRRTLVADVVVVLPSQPRAP